MSYYTNRNKNIKYLVHKVLIRLEFSVTLNESLYNEYCIIVSPILIFVLLNTNCKPYV